MKTRIISRRDFLKITSLATLALGLSQYVLPKKFLSSTSLKKPAVIWLEGQDCAGCTESVLSSLSPDIKDVLINTICLRYHETIMNGTGNIAENVLQAAIEEGGYVLVVEGSIPIVDDKFLYIADKPFEEIFVESARNASIIIALGTCAAFGGIPKSTPTIGESVQYFLSKYNISKSYINLPGCPAHPIWFFDTIISYLVGNTIEVDNLNRPKNHYGKLVHSQCPRIKNKFLTDWNDPTQQNYCLFKKGCKGKFTYSDCPSLKWNDGVNWCIGNNAPCSGCTQPEFYNDFSPIYK